MKDRRITIKVEDTFFEKVKIEADKLGLSVSAYIRFCLSEKINKEKG